ncbi:NAD(+) diphosphatase [Leucobacter allii]|uniref:NAD(+) diphosphatase n=1 Tax=Leucobacter allii TaxID=2932247 RepID=A0ABY4FGY9_9MICO|nr:NAD(+) diphosphatase [Leucobacter allii]UOQ55815.1 NAD(+) diphosphatase [Leucobacter allii]
MTTNRRPPLSSGALDRDARTRMDPERLAAAWRDPAARVLRLRGVEVPVIAADGGEALALLPAAEFGGAFAGSGPEGRAGHLFLGRRDGAPVFGVAESVDDGAERVAGLAGETWRHPFVLGTALDETERELIAVLSSLTRWHESARFSARDGGLTEPMQGGWARRDAHGGEHFPRTDPAVIVLVEHEGRVLLGSNALWETGRFSLLAGFVEGGESLEQTVLREVYEEAGVRLGEVAYVASQPWPFPRSLMLGFLAKLAPDQDPEALRPDPEEISELRWFSREELRENGGSFTFPMSMSIAHWMLEEWVEGRIGEAAAALSEGSVGR